MIIADFCQQIARQNLGYDVEAYDTKMRAHATRANEDEAFLKQYEADRRSIYVAGLPADIEEDEVARYFEDVGEVVRVEIYQRRSMDGGKTFSHHEKSILKDSQLTCDLLATLRAFAFVEFVRLDLPDIAIAKLVCIHSLHPISTPNTDDSETRTIPRFAILIRTHSPSNARRSKTREPQDVPSP